MVKTRVGDWMTRNPVIVLPTTRLTEAYALMAERHIRRLPVVEKGKLVGIVTLGDLRQAGASIPGSEAEKSPVEAVMSQPVITVTPETTLREAARLMIKHKVSGLPVLQHGELVGIITESDIFRAVMLSEEEEVAEPKPIQQLPPVAVL